VLPEEYGLILPALPDSWAAVLEEPDWRITWIGPDGQLAAAVIPADAPPPQIQTTQERPAMVLAWPAWPDRDLPAGRMRPAGAIFPHDMVHSSDGGSIRLTWEAGSEAYLFLLMAAQTSGDAADVTAIPAKNRAWNFNWPRFRELLKSGDIPAAIREDPWLADWKTVAQKTLASGFDRRRIKVPEGKQPLPLAIPADGPWFGTSPFAPSHAWIAGEAVELEAGEETETLISPAGQLRYGGGIWMWIAR
jgi:hypothetical protein